MKFLLGLALFISVAGAQSVVIAGGTAQSIGSINGQAHQALARTITVAIDDVNLPDAIQQIAAAAQLRVVYPKQLIPKMRVSLRANNITVKDAFERVLRNTQLQVVASGSDQIVVTPRPKDRPEVHGGIITGKVTDSKSGKGIPGAGVSINGNTTSVTTSEDGAYRLVAVPIGTHTVVVRLLGYAKQTRTLMVGEGATVVADFKLEASTSVLSQVVVTGTVVQTELKAVPNAITIITAKQIEERGITKIDQLFRGDIPGLFAQNQGSLSLLDEVTMFSRGATALSFSSAGTQLGTTNPIKTYVDGVELADPKYLSQIDPRIVERIEILAGPQASTIYGSNAINGVMQIFTKRGHTSRPQLTLNLLSGWVENNFSNARTVQHDYSAQLSGIEGRISYNVGGSWNYMGPWTPAKQFARTGSFGGVRLDLPTTAGHVTVDMTLRHALTQSLQHGTVSQTLTGYRETGWYVTNNQTSGYEAAQARTLAGRTLGLTFSYAPVSWWSHEFGIGSDISDTEKHYISRGYLSISDTTLRLDQTSMTRRSIRYATTARLSLTPLTQLTVTAGADAWQDITSSISAEPQKLTGPLTNVTGVSNRPGHNTGGFLQTQLGLKDHLFLTYGLRAEWNPNYGDDAQPNYAPRYGMAYTHEIGPMTVKLRGSYGRSTRPPQPGLKDAQTIADVYGSESFESYFFPYYGGTSDYRLANPALGPEYQKGGEGGLELYLGTRTSLVVTRYNQKVDGLIASAVVDSVRSMVPCAASDACWYDNRDADGYGYNRQYQYLNVGSIRNQGWELQGSVNLGPLTTHGTYSWTKSRTIGVNPKYRPFFANQSQYQPGATFRYLPEHTWAFAVTYARGSSSVGFNTTGIGRVANLQDDFFLRNLNSSIRLPQNRLNVNSPTRYIFFNAPYVLADLQASHRFTSKLEALLQVQNLGDRYTNDYNAVYASLGRQVKIGARVRTR